MGQVTTAPTVVGTPLINDVSVTPVGQMRFLRSFSRKNNVSLIILKVKYVIGVSKIYLPQVPQKLWAALSLPIAIKIKSNLCLP